MELYECWWCGGTAVDEEGCTCLACRGTASVTRERIVDLGGSDLYGFTLPADGKTPAERVREAIG